MKAFVLNTKKSVSRIRQYKYVGLITVVAAYIGLAITQSVLLPVFEGPDEQKHYAYARFLVNNRALPPIVRSREDSGIAYSVGQMAGNPPLYYALVSLVSTLVPAADDVHFFTDHNEHWQFYDVVGVPYDNHTAFLHGKADRPPYAGAGMAVHVSRVVSIVLGSLTIVGFYGIARTVAPERRSLAVLASAIGCLPQFLFLTSAITTDVGVIAFATLTLWTGMKMIRIGPRPAIAVIGGLTSGLTVLCKVNGIWVIGIICYCLAASLYLRRHSNAGSTSNDDGVIPHRHRTLLAHMRDGAIILAVFTAVSGWWFWRSAMLSGDPFGLRIHAIGDAQSPLQIAQPALNTLAIQLSALEESVWFRTGWAGLVPPPAPLLTIYRTIFAIGFIGFFGDLIARIRKRIRGKHFGVFHSDQESDRTYLAQIIGLSIACVTALIGAIYWILIYIWPLGRLTFPALGAAATLVAMGWGWWFEILRRLPSGNLVYHVGRVVLGSSLAYGSILGVVTTARALNPHPAIRPLEDTDIRTHVDFIETGADNTKVASIVAYRYPQMDFRSGGAFFAHLCWRGYGYTKENVPYSLQLVGPDDVRPGTRNSYHGLGTFPLLAWEPDEEFCDPIAIKIDDIIDRPRAYRLLATMFTHDPESKETTPLTALDSNGNSVQPFIGRVRVAPSNPPPVPEILHQFGTVAGLAETRAELSPNGVLDNVPVGGGNLN
jgi:hypothetical protein